MKKIITFCLLLLCSLVATSQEMRFVQGVVLGNDGIRLAGITVEAEDANLQTVSKHDGTFEMSVPIFVKNLMVSNGKKQVLAPIDGGYIVLKLDMHVDEKSVVEVNLKKETDVKPEVIQTAEEEVKNEIANTKVSVVESPMIVTEESQKTADVLIKNMSRRQRNCAYVELAGSFGHLMGIGLNAGAYFSMFNIEAYGYYGLQSEKYYEYRFSPLLYGGKVGVAIQAGKSFAFTPQLGAGVMMILGEHIRVTIPTLSLGARCEYFITKHLGLSITPEYTRRFDSEVMSIIAEQCPIVEQWYNGFNVRLGFYYNF